MATCPFTILGLAPSATIIEVTSAYRKLALRYHPDKNQDMWAAERMVAINVARDRALEILNSGVQREQASPTSSTSSNHNDYTAFSRPSGHGRRRGFPGCSHTSFQYRQRETQGEREQKERQDSANRAENARHANWRRRWAAMEREESQQAEDAQHDAEHQRQYEPFNDDDELTEEDFRRHEEILNRIYAENARQAEAGRAYHEHMGRRREREAQEHEDQMAAISREHQARLARLEEERRRDQETDDRLRAEATLLAERVAILAARMRLADRAQAIHNACVLDQTNLVAEEFERASTLRTARIAQIAARIAETARGRQRRRTTELREQDFDTQQLHKPSSSAGRCSSSKHRVESPPDADSKAQDSRSRKRQNRGSKDQQHGRKKMRYEFEAHKTVPYTAGSETTGFWDAASIPISFLPMVQRPENDTGQTRDEAYVDPTLGFEHLCLVDIDGDTIMQGW